MIQSKIRCQTFCEGLVQEMTMHSSSDAFQSKCLALLVHIFDLPKKSAINAHLFSKSFIMSGGLGCVVRVIETFSTDLELQKLTMQVLARLLKGYIPVDHCCDRIPAAVVRTMNAFPSDEFIQTSSCYVLLCYSKNDPQRMKHVIAADGLEALAKACGNFPHSTKISEATKHLLNHAIVSFYQVFEETRDTKEKEYSTV